MFAADPSPWLAVFGRAHPLLLHAPLGILPAIAVLEFGALLLRRASPRGAVLTLSWFCALSAVAAAVSGLVLAGEGHNDGAVQGQHKIAGITLAVLCVFAAIAASWQRRATLRIVLGLALCVMVPTGHLGGVMTHGADFLTAPLTGPAEAAPRTGNGFVDTIEPFLQRTCVPCHRPSKRKGELELDTQASIMQGGKHGAVLVPGKPDDSPMLTRCELPLDADEHMPPDGKLQATKAEIAALRQWIADGAAF